MNSEKNWKAYVAYYGDNIVDEYNLKESPHIELYNIGENIGINELHYHYSELVAAYYIWKTQLKYDYICLWDHRRFLTPINFEKLDKNMIQTYYHGYTELTPFEYMLKDGINEYIIYQFIKYMIEQKHIGHDILIDKIYNQPWKDHIWFHSCFNCNLKVFNDICEFIFGFLSYIIPNSKYEDKNSCDSFIQDLQRSILILKSKCKDNEIIDYGRIESGDRDFANFFEMLIPLYCDFMGYQSFSETEEKNIALKLLSYNKSNIIETLRKWIAKNTFTGCRNFTIITSDKHKGDLQEIVNSNGYILSTGAINVISENEINTLNNHIILELTDYLDIESPNMKISEAIIKKF